MMYLATLETRSYTFTGLGRTEREAEETIRIAWLSWVQSHNWDQNMYCWHELDVNVMAMEPGVPCMDKQQIGDLSERGRLTLHNHTLPMALPGIWTPWAQVLCYEAHGPKFHNKTMASDEFDRLCQRQVYDPRRAVATKCDETGADIFVQWDVGILNNLRLRLTKAGLDEHLTIGMAQTGGMCSALEIHPTPNESNNRKPEWLICITDGEEQGDDEGTFLICRYKYDEWTTGDIDETETIGLATSPDEAEALIRAAIEEG